MRWKQSHVESVEGGEDMHHGRFLIPNETLYGWRMFPNTHLAQTLLRQSLRIAAPIALCIALLCPKGVTAKYGAEVSAELSSELSAHVGTRWYGVYVFGKKAGYAKMAFRVNAESYEIEEEVVLEIQAMGTAQGIRMSALRKYDKNTGGLSSVQSAFTQNTQEVRAEFEVQDSYGRLTQWVAGQKTQTTVPAPKENILDALALSIKQKAGNLKGTVETSIFEALPPISKEIVMEHRVVKSETRVVNGVRLNLSVVKTKVPEHGIHYRTLMRDDGVVVETEMMGMMKLRLEPERIAKSQGVTPDVLTLSLAVPNEPIQTPRSVRELELRIDLPRIPETFTDGHVELMRKASDYVEIRLTSPPLEQRRGTEIAPVSALAPTALIQSNAPGIISKAKEITRGSKSKHETIERLVKYVSGTLKKEYRAALSNALDVLKDPTGDCTEHAVYFVALARAVKIPSRIVVGLTYTAMGKGGFGGHAWAEVLYRGAWHPVDPTFGQLSADATHIPLGIGNLADITHVAALIGQVRVRVLDVQHRKE